MSLDFFETEQLVKSVEKFGIIDPAQEKGKQHKPAEFSYQNEDKWNTTVISHNGDDVYFNAIDGNIIFYKSLENKNEKERSCDAMLHTKEIIIFLEIKDWKQKIKDKTGKKITFWESATEQLENTIKHFYDNHSDMVFSKKYAYISNKHKPNFEFSNPATQQSFKDKTLGFILKVSTTIDLKKTK